MRDERQGRVRWWRGEWRDGEIAERMVELVVGETGWGNGLRMVGGKRVSWRTRRVLWWCEAWKEGTRYRVEANSVDVAMEGMRALVKGLRKPGRGAER